jgi:hypothetical protein
MIYNTKYIRFFILYIHIPIDLLVHIRIVHGKHLLYDISNDQYIQLHTPWYGTYIRNRPDLEINNIYTSLEKMYIIQQTKQAILYNSFQYIFVGIFYNPFLKPYI